MKKGDFPLDDLPGWCVRHGAELHGVKVANVEGQGLGWIAQQSLKNDGGVDERPAPLLVVPGDVIISAIHVGQYAVANAKFHQLLAAIGYESDRQLILIHMLVQLVLSSPDYKGTKLTHDPWTEYICLQPSDVPVPTMWSAAELSLLRSTSLESAVAAKLALLAREFALIQAKAVETDFGREIFSSGVTLRDWIWVDALFRSRSFELPVSGVACVPCLDLANHSRESTAYFQQDPQTETVTLLLRKGCSLSAGEEVTIGYGKDKPAAEMLFNYGFVEESAVQSLVLPLDEVLEAHADDPWLRDKLRVFNAAPMLELKMDRNGKARWSAPFLSLMCVKEGDGLSFKAQQDQGQESRRILWRGKDVTGMVGMWDVFINAQDIRLVVRFRAVSIVLGVVGKQLGRLRSEVLHSDDKRVETGEVRRIVMEAAIQLRSIEEGILERTIRALEEERERLLKDETVVAFLQTQST